MAVKIARYFELIAELSTRNIYIYVRWEFVAYVERSHAYTMYVCNLCATDSRRSFRTNEWYILCFCRVDFGMKDVRYKLLTDMFDLFFSFYIIVLGGQQCRHLRKNLRTAFWTTIHLCRIYCLAKMISTNKFYS